MNLTTDAAAFRRGADAIRLENKDLPDNPYSRETNPREWAQWKAGASEQLRLRNKATADRLAREASDASIELGSDER